MAQADTPNLSTLEWSAVSIALQDAASCGCAAATPDHAPKRLHTRALELVFGTRRPNRLADPRLEAIRQFVCTTRRQRKPAESLAPALSQHGFNQAQIDAIALLSI
jgi:hypothetical protein